jgi:glycosyltransferase involved in cell wall biosynthesis
MIIINGSKLFDVVKNTYHVQDDRITYIPLCPRFTVTKWGHQNRSEEPGTVLFFGRAHPHKGLEYLLKAQPLITAKAPEVRFLLAVHGNDLKSYRQLICNPNYFIIREGFIPGPEMAEIYEQSSLVVLPYLSAATSGVLLDAYMFGKPVVATRVGCLPEYVQDGITGLLVPPRDPASLAQAIVCLIQDEKMRTSMGKNAREWINNVGKTIATQHVQVYQGLIK